VYGYEQDEEKSHVITDFIKMAKKDGIIKMRTNGEEVRQFLYGDDCAECLIELSKQYNNIERNKQLHITNFKWNSILEIATLIQTLSNCSISPSENKDTVQLDKRNEPDPYILNFWQPTTSLKEGIIKIYNLI
jgi:nucleoside-diphosphate-sugar epimerase